MFNIQVLIKDNDSYDLILNRKLIVLDAEIVDELEYMVERDINYLLNKYKRLIKEGDKNEWLYLYR